MKDGIHAAAGLLDRCHILNIPPQGFHAKFGQNWIITTGQSANLMTLDHKLPRDGLAEKAPCPGDECVHAA
jgi:hypothetical protein